jgi:hypothetical protein
VSEVVHIALRVTPAEAAAGSKQRVVKRRGVTNNWQ